MHLEFRGIKKVSILGYVQVDRIQLSSKSQLKADRDFCTGFPDFSSLASLKTEQEGNTFSITPEVSLVYDSFKPSDYQLSKEMQEPHTAKFLQNTCS